MTAVAIGCIAALMVAGALGLARAIRPGTLADRSVGLDTALAVLVNGLAILVVLRDDTLAVDLVLLATLVGFLGTITVARFIERRGL
jgi:multicomponent Na+:H+ antiporter subunit F